jgi:Tfp pilus assembly protein PilO
MLEQDREWNIKTIGLYMIVILIIARFIIYPLRGGVTSGKSLLSDERENYRVKQQLLIKSKQINVTNNAPGEPSLLPRLYEKNIPPTLIQAAVLESLVKKAEESRLTVYNYEMPDISEGKYIGVIPMTIRVQGPPEGFIEFVRAVEAEKKALIIQSLNIRIAGNDNRYDLTIAAFRLVQ